MAGWPDLISPILIVGAPRSGTTWLAKIIDSHPDVLYRHEPDDDDAFPTSLDPAAASATIRRWAASRTPRTATKRPFFAKSYRIGWRHPLRGLLVAGLGAAARLPPPFRSLARLRVPDLLSHPPPRVAMKSIRLAQAAAVIAAAVPDCRVLFILRHPCGQVASIMRGNGQRRFDLKTAGTDMPFDEAAAILCAARHDVTEADFQALPDAAKYAWSWRAFNDPACAELAHLSNARIVSYETLCAEPEAEARRIFAFCGLPWHAQTQAFIARSSRYDGHAGYYAIVRNALAAAQAWQSAMPQADQEAVRRVAGGSPLAAKWPDVVKL